MGDKILLIGHSAETAIQHVLNVAVDQKVDFDFVNVGDFLRTGFISMDLSDPESVELSVASETIAFRDYSGIYQRLVSPMRKSEDGAERTASFSKFMALETGLRLTQTVVVNRPGAGWENFSKPLQTAMLAQAGFRVLPFLSTSLQEDCLNYTGSRATIYKSNSSVRSVVNLTSGKPSQSMANLSTCPVLFQEYASGLDVRVHSVGKQCFAVTIESDTIDYRYYKSQGTFCRRRPCYAVPTEIRELCVNYAASRGVLLAGFDFKVNKQGVWTCLEMNPMPSFEGFDNVLNDRIAVCLIGVLRSKKHAFENAR